MVVAIAIVRMRDLFAVIMMSGIFGLLSASFFVAMDAVDVAFTEASVGAGIATLLMLTAVTLTGRAEDSERHRPMWALVVVFITGGLLIYGTLDMPYFGNIGENYFLAEPKMVSGNLQRDEQWLDFVVYHIHSVGDKQYQGDGSQPKRQNQQRVMTGN